MSAEPRDRRQFTRVSHVRIDALPVDSRTALVRARVYDRNWIGRPVETILQLVATGHEVLDHAIKDLAEELTGTGTNQS